MRVVQKLRFGFVALMAPVLFSVPASAATILGGVTKVKLTAAPTLAALSLSFAPFGTATVVTDGNGIPTFSFPITGGSVDDVTGAALINHVDSGLSFAKGLYVLSISDFVVDTAAKTLRGTISIGDYVASNVSLFDIGNGLSLSMTAQTANLFSQGFGAPDLTGTTIGVAELSLITAAAAVAEPAAWVMMLLGFAVIGSNVRTGRRRAIRQTSWTRYA